MRLQIATMLIGLGAFTFVLAVIVSAVRAVIQTAPKRRKRASTPKAPDWCNPMREFFRGGKRKVGVVTLLASLLFFSGWIRSLALDDEIDVSFLSWDQSILSVKNGLIWSGTRHEFTYSLFETSIDWRSTRRVPLPPNTLSIVWSGGQTVHGDVRFKIGPAPYWSIVTPLTLLSAWLLLIKPRSSKPTPEPVGANGESHA